MIRLSVAYDKKQLRNIRRYMQQFDSTLDREVKREANLIGRSAIQELSRPVAPVRYLIQWASERQRKAFFASNGFGKDIPTRRTGSTLKQWRYEIIRNRDGYRFSIYNTKPYAKYLFGSLAQNKRKAARFQQTMHKNTGYPLAQPIVIEAIDKLAQALQTNIRTAMIREFKRRAFTGK